MTNSTETRVFFQTRLAIEKQSELKRGELIELKKNLQGLESLKDGDMMDDPLLHRMLEEQGMAEAELNAMLYLLSAEVLTFHPEKTGEINVVEVGHRVGVTIRYADGETEKIFVTIGSTTDVRYLSSNKSLFDGINELLISDKTPLGQALLSAKVGDEFTYNTGHEAHKGKVTSIGVSSLLS